MENLYRRALLSAPGKVKLTAALIVVIGSLAIVTVQFDRVRFSSVDDDDSNNSAKDVAEKNGEVYPTQKCEAEWFPARHWAWSSSKYDFQKDNGTHQEGGEKGEQMYGTVAVQHALWKHQHPQQCQDKKFLVYEALGVDHGIGSVVHVLSVALLAALNMDRILVLAPQPQFEWVQGKFCDAMLTLDECYFEPLSSCTILDAMADGHDVAELNEETYKSNSARVLRSSVRPMGSNALSSLLHSTPSMFHSLLQRGGISTKFYYWWRAQSSAYIVRPTLRTLRELDRRRETLFQGQRIEPGTISVHVRHGDKWKESKLETDATFLRAAEALLLHDVGPILQRRIFLSTEDPHTVQFFTQLSNWRVQYTNVTRDASDPNIGPEQFAARIGWDEEFLNSLLSLQLALECDGFVGAMTSNWNRLIDELRSTIRCKHHRVFVDVVQGFHIKNYNW